MRKKDDRLDWMYQGPAGQVSREEYLLGRPIDMQITQQYEEPESGPSAQTGLLPGSIFNPTSSVSTNDMAAKIREDPLFEIRKRKEEKKRGVLTNPVKMRRMEKRPKAPSPPRHRDRYQRSHNTNYSNDVKLESAATCSLEDRVKRNIYTIQRIPAALEKNFMRR
ncbi:pre-mRNA-splicing factor CWC25 homolog [Xyrauchen texanus]|uniref:pre-mRNA-splicing factor CWC25 homolog n=1 Tax=Xyrauchen texanus TaxID=154827 RepID=UPI0022429C57|nr:pre-mRNA-splicing factor CWC25 homolog [Xyrauchen texanus]